MAKTRVTLVVQWFPPEPALQPWWIAGALQRAGFDVDVVTGIPNYPSGRVVEGYRAWRPRVDKVDGMTVRRAPLYPSHDEHVIGRALNYLSWAGAASLFYVRHLRSRDVVLVYSSPATATVPALITRALFGTQYLLLVEDVWPDSVFSSGFLNGRVRRPIEWALHRFVDLTYRHARDIAVISPGMIDLLISRGVQPAKLSLIYNWVEDVPQEADRDAPDWRTRWGLSNEDFILMYAGNHGGAQSLSAVIEAVGRVALSERCHLVMIGDGVEKPKLEELAARVAPERVHFVQPQPRESMWGLMRAADAQVVALADRPIFSVTMPSKVPSIMAAGHPILAVAAGDVAQVVEESRCGTSAHPGDPQGIVDALMTIRRAGASERAAMGARGRAYYHETMSMRVGSRRLSALLAKAVERG
ncbi:glycosyltransferase family 4 protein [Nocardioides hungaricus]